MRHFARIVIGSLILLPVLCLTACGSKEGHVDEQTGDPILRVGTIAGPETALMEAAKQWAESHHEIQVEIIAFQDYVTPNEALADGGIDVNVYQHKPYLDMAENIRGYDFEIVDKTFVYPMGMYSLKHAALGLLPDKARVGIPNDPSNGARALRLLDTYHVITLRHDGFDVTLKDIQDNPRQWQFIEMDAAQLPRALSDLNAAVINTTFAVPAGLLPKQDALILETAASPYANLVVTRPDMVDSPELAILVEALHSEAVTELANDLFAGQAIPAW